MHLEKLLYESANTLGVTLTDNQCRQFMIYKDLLLEWNKRMNLTSITDEKEIILKHFADSVSIAAAVDMEENVSIIDVGTGAGFPGLPIKISYPTVNVTLLDSLQKRIGFLSEVVDRLSLSNVTCVHGRAEDIGKDLLYRENFDYCFSRAVANLTALSEYCLPFVKVGGYFISLKGLNILEEISDAENAINILGGEFVSCKQIDIPNTDISHSLVIIKKIRQTPSQYPRKAGKVLKNPIK